MSRWPIVRHIRYFILMWRVNRHYDAWASLGYLPTNAQHDYEVLKKIWRGEA